VLTLTICFSSEELPCSRHLTVVAGALTAALALSPSFSQGCRSGSAQLGWRCLRKRGPDRLFQRLGRLGKHQQLHRLGRQETLKERFGVKVVHVKLDDTANAVAKVLAEKAAGKNAGGSVDLIWINGENFASMKRQDLLMSPDWTTGLPNWAYVDHENKPTILTDFTIPTDGLESPWGGAKLVFFHDSAYARRQTACRNPRPNC
jgi:ABC-type uncharacterized transport system YnjBCD substrate-binding protein